MGRTVLDAQRDQVYDAEAEADPGAQLRSPDEVRRYVAAVVASPWWRERGWPERVNVRITSTRQGGRVASGGRSSTGWFVRFPAFDSLDVEARVADAVAAGEPVDPDDWPWAWREVVIAHELAHVTLLSEPVVYDLGHGPVFCRRHLELAASLAGPAVADDLRARFVEHDVLAYEPLSWDPSVGEVARAAALGAVVVG